MDEWGLAVLTDQHRRDLLEILDDRYNMRSTVIVSQLPLTNWHEAIGDPTLAMPFWIELFTTRTRSI